MSEKRYFKIEYDEEWYLFDSTTISEQLVKEQAEYGYGVFANSLSPSEVVELLNEQQATITALKNIFNDIITYSEWDSKKPYCSLRITVDKKTYYEIRKILNE